jgi:hypothetical protein
MAAAGMKMRQAGLIKKPLYVVPNHMLEQFGREFMHLYPNAKLLIAGKDDFTKARRKLLTAKIASGEWDGIIVTQSSFERLGMSREFQAQFLREQIAEYDMLLTDSALDDHDRGQHNLLKTIEKQKAQREERLKDLLAEDKKDDGLVFDELGVDHVFIDESHAFKNLETPTKMERVAGIQTSGSERAFDLYMKCRYLDEQHPGHGVTFATGTPIANTMVEMYTIQRYLDPHGLAARGMAHFDAWAATFGEVVDAMEISPDGKTLRPRSRFAKFTNLPELQQMFRAFADVKTAEMLNLPRPALQGGKPTTVACPMSEAQRAIQDSLVSRYEAIRSGTVKPWEDNALAVTTDGRKLALDARLLDAQAADDPGSKINALVANVVETWRRTAPTRGTQLIFADMGVHPTAWGYSVYQEVIDKLSKNGMPREEIADIGEADTDAKKQALFDKVRAGTVRVLLGSTQKMGTGTNVQKRLIALHHLDAPWKPAEVEQREGRILRQGNGNADVAIYRYVTEGSFDAYMWQALETKAKFIGQIMTGDSAVRQAEDIGGQELSYAEVKAIASGNPAVLTLAETDAELKRLAILKKAHADAQYTARKALRELPERLERLKRRLTALSQDIATAQAHADDPLAIGGQPRDRKTALALLGERLKTLPITAPEPRRVPLGTYRGLRFGLCLSPQHAPEVCVEGAATRLASLARDAGPLAVLHAVERLIAGYETECATARRDLGIAQDQLRDYEARLGGTFAHGDYLRELSALRDGLEATLSHPTASGETEGLATRIKALRAAHHIEPAPERPSRPAARLAEAVTTRLVHRRQDVAVTEEEPTDTAPEPVAPSPAPVAAQTAEIVQSKTPAAQGHTPQRRLPQRAAPDARQMRLF